MASFFGIDSVARGVAAGLVANQEVVIDHPDVQTRTTSSYSYYRGYYNRSQKESFYTFASGYRIFARPFMAEPGRNLIHVILIHESCFFQEFKDKKNKRKHVSVERKFVISGIEGPDDLLPGISSRLAADFNMPDIPEWREYIYSRLELQGCLRPVRVMQNSDLGWSVSAVELANIEEDVIVEAITSGLQDGSISLPEGDVDAPPLKDFDSLAEYLKEYAPSLARVGKSAKPLHDIDNDPLPAEISTMKRIPFPVQAHGATAIFKGMLAYLKGLIPDRVFFMNCGEMGSGKTQVANTLLHLLYHHFKSLRVLITVPQITIPQWHKEEILKTIPYAKVKVINNWKDTLKFIWRTRGKKPDGLEIVLMGHDRAKLGFEPWFCALWKRIRCSGKKVYAWHCPDCFKPLPDPDDEDSYAWWDVLAEGSPPEGIPPSGIISGNVQVKWKKATAAAAALRKCPHCGAVLRRPARKAGGETHLRPRLEPAWLMKKMLPKNHFDLMVIDEFHLFRGNSGRGMALASLVCICKFVLGLSGTPTTGRASSIYRILERICMNKLIEDGFEYGNLEEFVKRYGRLQDITKLVPADGVHTRRSNERKSTKELPGIAPSIYVRYLMSSVFIDLVDLGIPLVELDESVEFVDLDPEHREAYQAFHQDLERVCKKMVARGKKGAYSKFLPAVLNYAVVPREQEIVFDETEVVTAPGFAEDYISAPERKLLELVQEDIKQGRCAMVYAWYTNKYAIDERIHQVLTKQGIKSAVLKSHTVSSDDRQDWIREQISKGAQVIVTNIGLVEVGLNLIQTPSIYFFQNTYQTEKARQAAKRAHRPTQTKKCKIVYIVPNGTQCVPQFENSVACRAQAMYLEGRLLSEELSRYTDGYNALARDVSKCLAKTEVADKWKELAARDTIRTVTEADFQREQLAAFKRLQEITLSLCEGKISAAEAKTEIENMVKVLGLEDYLALKKRQQKRIAPGQLCLDFGA